VAPAPVTLDYGNHTIVNFQRVPGYAFEINMGTRAAVYHISDTPSYIGQAVLLDTLRVKNCRTLLEQRLTMHMPLLTATGTFGCVMGQIMISVTRDAVRHDCVFLFLWIEVEWLLLFGN